MIEIALLALLAVFYAWRYSKIDPDPDWALFNVWGFCGSVYGRDFVDCKTPAIHLFYLAIRKVVGDSIERVRFTYHVILSSLAILSLAFSWNPWNVLAFLVLVNSGWLLAFHGNVGGLSAALLFLALCGGTGWEGVVFLALAVFVEPKLIFSVAAIIVLKGWWIEGMILAAFALVVCAVIYRGWPKVWAWLVEANLIIPKRMNDARKGVYRDWMPDFTAKACLYIMPWLLLAVLARTEIGFWIPVCIYLILQGLGHVIRPNHLLPLAAWIAAAGLSPMVIIPLALADWISSGWYLGNIWRLFYYGLLDRNSTAKQVGQWLRDKPGTLWVNSLDCGVYIHARKPIEFGMNEQIEISGAAKERREVWRKGWQTKPPDWVVNEPGYGKGIITFNATGYKKVAECGHLLIFEKVRR